MSSSPRGYDVCPKILKVLGTFGGRRGWDSSVRPPFIVRCCPENRCSIVLHLVVFFAMMISALHRKLRHPSEFDAMVLLLMISSVRRSRAMRGFYLHYDSELERGLVS